MIGILLALQVNNWNEARKEIQKEIGYIDGMIADIQNDLVNYDFRIEIVRAKEESLQRLRDVLQDKEMSDPKSLAVDVIRGAMFGWYHGGPVSSSFDALIGSGNIEIIRDEGIRKQIVEYYDNSVSAQLRIDERKTSYPQISYQLIPRNSPIPTAPNMREADIQNDLTDQQLIQIEENIRQSSIRDEIIGEINLARFLMRVNLTLKEQANSLKDSLESYLENIN